MMGKILVLHQEWVAWQTAAADFGEEGQPKSLKSASWIVEVAAPTTLILQMKINQPNLKFKIFQKISMWIDFSNTVYFQLKIELFVGIRRDFRTVFRHPRPWRWIWFLGTIHFLTYLLLVAAQTWHYSKCCSSEVLFPSSFWPNRSSYFLNKNSYLDIFLKLSLSF